MIRTETIEVTPKLAEKWLTKYNWNNRDICHDYVNQYLDDILNGEWKEGGNTIRFADSHEDLDGLLLIDGQSFLTALVEAGRHTRSKKLVHIHCPVVYGCTEDTFERCDIGRGRTTAQALKRAGAPYYSSLGPILRGVHSMLTTDKGEDFRRIITGKRSGMTRYCVAWYKKYFNDDIQESMRYVFGDANVLKKRFSKARSPLALCHYIFFQIDHEAAATFFSLFKGTTSASSTNPVRAFSEWILDTLLDDPKKRLDHDEIIYHAFRTWNLHCSGKQVRSSKHFEDEVTLEDWNRELIPIQKAFTQ